MAVGLLLPRELHDGDPNIYPDRTVFGSWTGFSFVNKVIRTGSCFHDVLNKVITCLHQQIFSVHYYLSHHSSVLSDGHASFTSFYRPISLFTGLCPASLSMLSSSSSLGVAGVTLSILTGPSNVHAVLLALVGMKIMVLCHTQKGPAFCPSRL